MYGVMADYSQRMGWTAPAVSHNVVSGVLYVTHANTIAFENHGVRLRACEVLANTISAISEADAMAALAKSDFVVIQKSTTVGVYPYPFNTVLAGLQPKMQAACERTHFVLHRFRLYEDDVILYVRAVPEIRGATADKWITRDGLVLSAPASVLRNRPRIELAGASGWNSSEKAPVVTAEVVVPGKPPRTKFRRPYRLDGSRYEIAVNLEPKDIPEVEQVDIRLSFDRYWVPSEQGGGTDMRQLVLRSPDAAHLVRESSDR